MVKVEKTKFYSWKIGNLAKGCKQCVKGEKTVLFITGKCSLRCFYCPISDQKKNKDVIYFNEWPSRNMRDLFEEVKLCNSKGAGITGGDPLIKLERTVKFIKALKKKFGKRFHIHLYTPLNLVTESSLKKLYDSGLDEIRFHPDLYDDKLWKRLGMAKKYKWRVGVEVPVIPGIKKNYLKLIDFLCNSSLDDSTKNKIDFLNLNELEISDTNACKLVEKGYKAKDKHSYGVKGSEELAKELLRYIFNKKYKIDVHYCTCKLKDSVQLRNRIKKRAKNAAKAYDNVDEEGMLVRGAVYYGGVGALKSVKVLNSVLDVLKQNKVPKKYYGLDKKRGRLLTTTVVVEKLSREFKKSAGKMKTSVKVAIVREYPTHDCFNVETEFV